MLRSLLHRGVKTGKPSQERKKWQEVLQIECVGGRVRLRYGQTEIMSSCFKAARYSLLYSCDGSFSSSLKTVRVV